MQSEGVSCTYCPVGEMRPGTTTMALERPGTTLVVKEIPAEVCWACGEAHLTEDTVERLDAMLSAAEAAGAETAVRHFDAKPEPA